MRPKVLVIAEAANPKHISVALIGYSLARALGEVAEIHLVTEERNRDAIIEAGWPPKNVTFIDNRFAHDWAERIAKLLGKDEDLGWTIYSALYSVTYLLFELKVWHAFKARLRSNHWDIVHRITPVTPTIGSPLAKRCQKLGIPFIWGPINGGLPWPKAFKHIQRSEREYLSSIRRVYRIFPYYRSTRIAAEAIIVGSKHALEEIPAKYHAKTFYIPENGIDPERFLQKPIEAAPRSPAPIEIVFMGRLVAYKGADMLLEAATSLALEGLVKITIIGEGVERKKLEQITQEAQIQDHVRFLGWVDHRSIHEHLSHTQILGFPSIREFGGAVVLEAMAMGALPIVVDYGGPAEFFPDALGTKIPMDSRQSIVRTLKRTLRELVEDRDKLDRLRSEAQSHAYKYFTWSVKAGQIANIYAWSLGLELRKPNFGIPLGNTQFTL